MIVFWYHGRCTRLQRSQCASEPGWIARLVPVSSPFSLTNDKKTDKTPSRNVDSTLSNSTKTLLPWYLGYKGGNWTDAIQCLEAGDNGWDGNQAALNHGLNNHWAVDNTPWSWGYYEKDDIPVHLPLLRAGRLVICTRSVLFEASWGTLLIFLSLKESYIASTNPNRVGLVTGSVNFQGSPQSPDEGGPTLDNNETPG